MYVSVDQLPTPERSPEMVAPGEWDVSLSHGYDTHRDFLSAGIFRHCINISPLCTITLDKEAAIKLAADTAPEDAIPGAIDLLLEDSTTFIPEKPDVIDVEQLPRYTIDPRKAPEGDYAKKSIQSKTRIRVPSDVVGFSTYRMKWQANHIKREIAEGIVFGTKMRSEKTVSEAITRAERSRGRTQHLTQLGLVAEIGFLASQPAHTLNASETLGLAGISVALLSVLYKIANEANGSRQRLAPELLAHVQHELAREARRDVAAYFDEPWPNIIDVSPSRAEQRRQTLASQQTAGVQ